MLPWRMHCRKLTDYCPRTARLKIKELVGHMRKVLGFVGQDSGASKARLYYSLTNAGEEKAYPYIIKYLSL